MAYHILTTNLQLLQTVADLIDAGEGYPKPGGYTLHHALVETRHDGGEYALLADDVAAKYLATLVAAVTGDQGNAEQVAADWAALNAGEIASAEYTIPAGDFAGVVVTLGTKGVEWTPPDVMEI
jgi:hypothetical protein